MLSGTGFCNKLITDPDESYQLCCNVVCDLEGHGPQYYIREGEYVFVQEPQTLDFLTYGYRPTKICATLNTREDIIPLKLSSITGLVISDK